MTFFGIFILLLDVPKTTRQSQFGLGTYPIIKTARQGKITPKNKQINKRRENISSVLLCSLFKFSHAKNKPVIVSPI